MEHTWTEGFKKSKYGFDDVEKGFWITCLTCFWRRHCTLLTPCQRLGQCTTWYVTNNHVMGACLCCNGVSYHDGWRCGQSSCSTRWPWDTWVVPVSNDNKWVFVLLLVKRHREPFILKTKTNSKNRPTSNRANREAGKKRAPNPSQNYITGIVWTIRLLLGALADLWTCLPLWPPKIAKICPISEECKLHDQGACQFFSKFKPSESCHNQASPAK